MNQVDEAPKPEGRGGTLKVYLQWGTSKLCEWTTVVVVALVLLTRYGIITLNTDQISGKTLNVTTEPRSADQKSGSNR